jgi:hypothetical protein
MSESGSIATEMGLFNHLANLRGRTRLVLIYEEAAAQLASRLRAGICGQSVVGDEANKNAPSSAAPIAEELAD